MVSRVDSYHDLSISQLFARLDADNSGAVTENELVSKRPANVTATQAQQMFEQADTQHAGVLTRGDVASIFQSISSQMQASLIQAQAVQNTVLSSPSAITAFNTLAQDGSGQLTKDEFVSGLSNSMTSDQAGALWDTIVGNSGADQGSQVLTQTQFSTGLRSAAVSASDLATYQSVVSVLSGVSDMASHPESVAQSDPSQLFWSLNTDSNGSLSQEEFMNGLSGKVSTEQAGILWDQIATNSGAANPSQGLSEAQFTTGFAAVAPDLATSTPLTFTQDTINAWSSLLTSQGAATSYLKSSDTATIFAVMDGNSDLQLTADEFIAAETPNMGASQAADLWSNIVSNSGSEDASQGLSVDQFVIGFGAAMGSSSTGSTTGTSSTSSSSSSSSSVTAATSDQLINFLQNVSNSGVIPYNVGTTDPASLFQTLDSNQDGAVSQDEFVAARPKTIGTSQASTYWSAIAGASGNTGAATLSQSQFVQGLNTLGIGPFDQNALSSLSKAVDTLRSATPVLYNMGASDPSDIFASLDVNQTNTITVDQFVTARPSNVTAVQAQAVWERIVLGSGSPDSMLSLHENEFVTGYNSMNTATSDGAALNQVSQMLTRMSGQDNVTVNMGYSNPSDMFGAADADQNGMVSKDEFMAIRPASVSVAKASAYWNQIVNYSGSSDASVGLSEGEFVAGVNSDSPMSIGSDVLSQVIGLEQTASGIAAQPAVLTTNNDMTAQIDASRDGMISQSEFLAQTPTGVSQSQMTNAWNAIVANSGSTSPSSGLTYAEYQLGITSLVPDVQATTSSDQISGLLQTMGVSIPVAFDMASANPSDVFGAADTNADGVVTQDEFVSNRPTGMTDTQASTLWSFVVGNSGADSSAGLSEQQFVTGYSLTSPDALSNPGNYTTVSNLQTYLEAVRGAQPAAFDPTVYDPTAMFPNMDANGDALITQDEFAQFKPAALDDSYVSGAWQQIVSNSGADSNADGLTIDQFAAGFSAIDTQSLEQPNNDIINAYQGLLSDLQNGVVSSTPLQVSSDNSLETLSLDANADGTVGRSEFLQGLSGIMSGLDNPNTPSNKSYAIQQLLSAAATYTPAGSGSIAMA